MGVGRWNVYSHYQLIHKQIKSVAQITVRAINQESRWWKFMGELFGQSNKKMRDGGRDTKASQLTLENSSESEL